MVAYGGLRGPVKRTARTAGRAALLRLRGRALKTLSLARGTTSSELERTRGIRLFN
jgi:hypothetical protein